MNKRVIFIGLLLFSALVFLAGCTQPKQSLSQDPKEAYELLAKKSREAGPMRIAFKLTVELGQQAVYGVSSMEMNAEVFMLSKKQSKTLVSMSFMGQSMNTAIYNLNGKIIQCTEGLISGQGLQCQLGQEQEQMMGVLETEVKSLDEILYDYNISFAKDRTIAGRPAKCFFLEYTGKDLKDKSQFGATASPAALDNYSFKEEICLDLEKGFASYADVKTTVYSELSKEEKPGIGFKIEMTSFSTDVSEKDLELPIAFSLTPANCAGDKVMLGIIPFKEIYGKQATLKISGKEKTITIPKLTLFEKGKLEIEFDENVSIGQIELCIDKECQKTTCMQYWVE